MRTAHNDRMWEQWCRVSLRPSLGYHGSRNSMVASNISCPDNHRSHGCHKSHKQSFEYSSNKRPGSEISPCFKFNSQKAKAVRASCDHVFVQHFYSLRSPNCIRFHECYEILRPRRLKDFRRLSELSTNGKATLRGIWKKRDLIPLNLFEPHFGETT